MSNNRTSDAVRPSGASRTGGVNQYRYRGYDGGSNQSDQPLGKILGDKIKSFLARTRRDLWEASAPMKLGRRHRPDYLITVITIVLALFGLVVLYSIAPGIFNGNSAAINEEMIKRVIMLIVGIVAFAVASVTSLNFWKKLSLWLFLFGLIICVALPLLGLVNAPFVTCALGACRWYDLGIVSFQPAELLKLATVLFMAGYLSTRLAHGQLNSNATLIEVILVMLISLGAVVGLQKDMGTGAVLLAIFIIQLWMSGMEMKKLLVIGAVMLALFIAMIAIAPHRIARILTFTQSGNEDQDYHINQALIALGSGGLTGRGLGRSVQAFGWLPEAVNDSIFAIIGESLGFVGAMCLVLAFSWLIMRMFKKTTYLDNLYLRLVVSGIVGWFASHVVFNIAAMTHIIPLTGITLPLVSSGGTSLIFVMFSLGLVFNISRYTTHRQISLDEVNEGKSGGRNEDSLRGRWQRRPHHANRGGNQ